MGDMPTSRNVMKLTAISSSAKRAPVANSQRSFEPSTRGDNEDERGLKRLPNKDKARRHERARAVWTKRTRNDYRDQDQVSTLFTKDHP